MGNKRQKGYLVKKELGFIYITTDGNIFTNEDKAKKHEKQLKKNEKNSQL